jgi:parvulin-like peptidyl-prolyl isomerase
MDPDRRNAVFLMGGIALVVIIAIALIGYGYYNDRIKPNHATVLRVGDQTFDYNFLKRRVQADLNDSKIDISQEDAIPRVLGNIEQEAVLRELGKREDIRISDADLMAKIADNLGLPEDSKRNQIASVLRLRLIRLGISLDEMEDIVRAQVVETQVKSKIEESIPASAEQVAVRLIQTSTQSAALTARDRLRAGESFAIVAATVSEDETSKATGGDLGLVPRGALPAEVEKVAFSTLGLSDVIETKSAFFVIEVLDKRTDVVGSGSRELVISTTFATKLEQTREAIGGTEPRLTRNQVQRILNSLSVSRV